MKVLALSNVMVRPLQEIPEIMKMHSAMWIGMAMEMGIEIGGVGRRAVLEDENR